MWIIPQFVWIALGTLVSEDLTCIATGVLVAQQRVGFLEGTLACIAGIFAGDMALYSLGRIGGDRRILGRWISLERLETASAWIEKRGWKVVLVSRFTPGLRLPTYVAAGLLRSRLWTFSGYILLASFLWTPLLVGASAAFGEQALKSALTRESPSAVAMAVAVFFAISRLRDFETRRRVVGFVRRKLQWEFWPAWAAYLPLAPYFVYLALKHRSVTLFTGANPGMFAGGLIGESKSEILRHLSRVAPFFVVRRGGAAKIEEFPVVLKPDIGERGSGVFIARSQQEVDIYLKSAACDIIIQKYVPGCEFGVYYLRHPHESAGRVIYVTEKRFPHVTGDGRRSLRDLILQDSRAVCLASAYFRVAKCPLETIPGKGEHVQLVEIGSHCRGTVFLDGSRWITPELNAAIDLVSRSHPGFHLGRYDVRTASTEALQRGEFQVIELNGVSAEATHIYDPSIPVWRKYHVMASHWRTAFEIGAIHRARGFQPMTVRELRQLLLPWRSTAASPLTHVA